MTLSNEKVFYGDEESQLCCDHFPDFPPTATKRSSNDKLLYLFLIVLTLFSSAIFSILILASVLSKPGSEIDLQNSVSFFFGLQKFHGSNDTMTQASINDLEWLTVSNDKIDSLLSGDDILSSTFNQNENDNSKSFLQIILKKIVYVLKQDKNEFRKEGKHHAHEREHFKHIGDNHNAKSPKSMSKRDIFDLDADTAITNDGAIDISNTATLNLTSLTTLASSIEATIESSISDVSFIKRHYNHTSTKSNESEYTIQSNLTKRSPHQNFNISHYYNDSSELSKRHEQHNINHTNISSSYSNDSANFTLTKRSWELPKETHYKGVNIIKRFNGTSKWKNSNSSKDALEAAALEVRGIDKQLQKKEAKPVVLGDLDVLDIGFIGDKIKREPLVAGDLDLLDIGFIGDKIKREPLVAGDLDLLDIGFIGDKIKREPLVAGDLDLLDIGFIGDKIKREPIVVGDLDILDLTFAEEDDLKI